MKPSVEQLENLLALKRYERPEEGYWQDFLCDFHHNQRQQAAVKTGLAGIFEKATAWVSELGPTKWAYGAGLAYATYAAVTLLTPKPVDVERNSSSPVIYQVDPAPAPAAVEQLDQLDLSPSTQGNAGEQVF